MRCKIEVFRQLPIFRRSLTFPSSKASPSRFLCSSVSPVAKGRKGLWETPHQGGHRNAGLIRDLSGNVQISWVSVISLLIHASRRGWGARRGSTGFRVWGRVLCLDLAPSRHPISWPLAPKLRESLYFLPILKFSPFAFQLPIFS